MKGKTHLAINTIILITIIIFFLIYETELKILFIFSRIFKEQTLTILTISSILFILGAIIPDIDSKNNKSYIFYKPILKTIAKIIKYPILLLWDIKHRGFFHSITGTLLTSIIITTIISIPYYLITKNISLYTFLFWLLSLFSGQLLHLIQDKIKNPFWKIKLA